MPWSEYFFVSKPRLGPFQKILFEYLFSKNSEKIFFQIHFRKIPKNIIFKGNIGSKNFQKKFFCSTKSIFQSRYFKKIQKNILV